LLVDGPEKSQVLDEFFKEMGGRRCVCRKPGLWALPRPGHRPRAKRRGYRSRQPSGRRGFLHVWRNLWFLPWRVSTLGGDASSIGHFDARGFEALDDAFRR